MQRGLLFQMVGGGLFSAFLLSLGALAGYAYARWEGNTATSYEKTMDRLTAECVGSGRFSYKGFGYYCSLDEEGKKSLIDGNTEGVEI